MILLSIFFILFVHHPAKVQSKQWQQCFDNACPIKNLDFFKSNSGFLIGNSFKVEVNKHMQAYDEFGNQLLFSLSAYGVIDNINRTTSIQLTKYASSVLFTCSRSSNSASDLFDAVINETSIYVQDKLFLSWSITINEREFPYELIDPPDFYRSDHGYQIFYNLTQTRSVDKANYSQLPMNVDPFTEGYQFKAVGTEKYLLIARIGNKSTDFLLQVNEKTPNLVKVYLIYHKYKNRLALTSECNFNKSTVAVFTESITYGSSFNIENQVHNLKMDGNQCLWSLPDSINPIHLHERLEPKKKVFTLQIIEDKRFIYFDEDDFRLSHHFFRSASFHSSSNSLHCAKLLMILSMTLSKFLLLKP